jgi:hypothetical protein
MPHVRKEEVGSVRAHNTHRQTDTHTHTPRARIHQCVYAQKVWHEDEPASMHDLTQLVEYRFYLTVIAANNTHLSKHTKKMETHMNTS